MTMTDDDLIAKAYAMCAPILGCSSMRPGDSIPDLAIVMTTLAERLKRAGEERDRHAAGANSLFDELFEIKKLLGLAAGGVGLPVIDDVRKLLAQLTAANERIAEAETTYKLLMDQLGKADAERHQAVVRLHEAQVQSLGFADHSPAITWPEMYREKCRRIAALEAELTAMRGGVENYWGMKYTCGCPAQRSRKMVAHCSIHCKPLDETIAAAI